MLIINFPIFNFETTIITSFIVNRRKLISRWWLLTSVIQINPRLIQSRFLWNIIRHLNVNLRNLTRNSWSTRSTPLSNI